MEHCEAKHLKTGRRGEDLAVEYLQKRGYKIVTRNYWKPYGEIDIVAQKGETVYFIEVKTVTREKNDVNHGTSDEYKPEDNMHSYKIQRLRRVIETYLAQNDPKGEWDFEIGLICVIVAPNGELLSLDYLEDVDLS